jgi:DNA-binding MarR family transcriptional regulator
MTSSPAEIPAHVRRFLEENIDTVPQLETLLMMYEKPDRDWLTTDVASRNYITEPRATETLSALQRRGLVIVEESPRRFRFNPTKDEDRALVAELAQCYQRKLSAVTELIHAKASASVKEFARAFDLKKDR